MSDSQQEREMAEMALRRLLTEAVEPLQPAPGSQDRLERRIRGGQNPRRSRKKRDYAAGLGWSSAGLVTAGAVVAAVIFGGHHGDSSSSTSSAASAPSAKSAESAPSAAASAAPPGVPSDAAASRAAVPDRAGLNSKQRKGAKESTAGSATGSGSGGAAPKFAGVGADLDLDGDGLADEFAMQGRSLVVMFGKGGQQSVTLPSVGAGARVLGVTRLEDAARNAVPVVFIRLKESAGASEDTLVTLADGRLTVLTLESRPVVLGVNATSGYACNAAELAVSGHSAAFVVQGSQLMPSPRLRAVSAPAGSASGCW